MTERSNLMIFFVVGESVAQFKFTLLLMPNGPMKITGLPVDLDLYESEHSVQDAELKELLSKSASRRAAKRKKKKAEKAAIEATTAEVQGAPEV